MSGHCDYNDILLLVNNPIQWSRSCVLYGVEPTIRTLAVLTSTGKHKHLTPSFSPDSLHKSIKKLSGIIPTIDWSIWRDLATNPYRKLEHAGYILRQPKRGQYIAPVMYRGEPASITTPTFGVLMVSTDLSLCHIHSHPYDEGPLKYVNYKPSYPDLLTSYRCKKIGVVVTTGGVVLYYMHTEIPDWLIPYYHGTKLEEAQYYWRDHIVCKYWSWAELDQLQ